MDVVTLQTRKKTSIFQQLRTYGLPFAFASYRSRLALFQRTWLGELQGPASVAAVGCELRLGQAIRAQDDNSYIETNKGLLRDEARSKGRCSKKGDPQKHCFFSSSKTQWYTPPAESGRCWSHTSSASSCDTSCSDKEMPRRRQSSWRQIPLVPCWERDFEDGKQSETRFLRGLA